MANHAVGRVAQPRAGSRAHRRGQPRGHGATARPSGSETTQGGQPHVPVLAHDEFQEEGIHQSRVDDFVADASQAASTRTPSDARTHGCPGTGYFEHCHWTRHDESNNDSTPNKLSYDDDWVYSPQEDTVDCMFSPMTSRAPGEESAVKQQQQQQHDGRGTEQVILSEKNHNLSIHSNKAMLVAAAATSSDAASAHALDGDIRRMKKRNQQRAKEDLIIAAFERLQDDTQLVADVQNLLGIRSSGGGGGAGNDNSMFDWFVGTPHGRGRSADGILGGKANVNIGKD